MSEICLYEVHAKSLTSRFFPACEGFMYTAIADSLICKGDKPYYDSYNQKDPPG